MIRKVITGIARVISGAIYLLIITAIVIALLPMVAGYRPVVVLSGSMEPAYPIGSVIYYKASGYEDINVGDAITFRIGGGALATHRVIEKDDTLQEFKTKGDNNPTEDVNPIAYTEVVGKTAKIAIPYAGVMATHLKEIPIIIMIGAVLIICSMLTPERRKVPHKDEDNDFDNED
jgi:signal peptidase I, archaeal type